MEHLPLVGYFLLIAVLLVTVFPDLLRRPTPSFALFALAALLSLAFTWTWMIRYFQYSKLQAGASVPLCACGSFHSFRQLESKQHFGLALIPRSSPRGNGSNLLRCSWKHGDKFALPSERGGGASSFVPGQPDHSPSSSLSKVRLSERPEPMLIYLMYQHKGAT